MNTTTVQTQLRSVGVRSAGRQSAGWSGVRECIIVRVSGRQLGCERVCGHVISSASGQAVEAARIFET